MTEIDRMSSNDGTPDNIARELVTVSTISKTGNRYVVGLPAKYKDFAARNLGAHVVVTIKPIL